MCDTSIPLGEGGGGEGVGEGKQIQHLQTAMAKWLGNEAYQRKLDEHL